eukprot:TRINITY_DN1490_c0_g1_i1.p1 TRINITY_DN1490_c0_g1~~TRINITY_DN1490_c0_g1_i1.p1  ORF type:complete len:222 (-),score=69.93 TRINITY_DN1490_c0_g1_i1:350-1015(-)
MNEAEVQKQIQQMINFIQQEAEEKAREIDEKAEEEFHMEKAQLVQAEKLKIMKEYEKKFKAINLQKKTKVATIHQDARLKILQAQDETLMHLLHVAEQHLPQLSTSGPKYQKLLKNLIHQALVVLDETTVIVSYRAQDASFIQACAEEAIDTYNKKHGKKVTFTLDPKHITCFGGAIIASKDNRIRVDNTLDTRLRLTYENSLPATRQTLFGVSQNRKFVD